MKKKEESIQTRDACVENDKSSTGTLENWERETAAQVQRTTLERSLKWNETSTLRDCCL